MPNLKQLKALRKLMQEEGLARQVEKIDPILANELKRNLGYKKAGAEIDDVVAADAIGQARHLREHPAPPHEDFDIDHIVNAYPSKDLNANQNARGYFTEKSGIKDYSPENWERIRALMGKKKVE